MKKIKDVSQHFDHQPGETGSYLDASFYLKKFLRFDGDRYTITANEQIGDQLWRFTVRSADGSEDKYLSSSTGMVKHVAGN